MAKGHSETTSVVTGFKFLRLHTQLGLVSCPKYANYFIKECLLCPNQVPLL